MNNLNNIFKGKDNVFTNKRLVKSLREYLELLEEIRQYWNRRDLWYRGVSSFRFDLRPTTYRQELWDYTIENEKKLVSQFTRKSFPFLSSNHYEKWELYQLMQHYGIPTRFLDWTESSLIALLFALFDIKASEKPTVWVIDPFRLNRIVTNKEVVYFSMNIGDNIDYEITSKYFDIELNKLPEFPIAVLPTFIDKRIIAQKSCFTIHGTLKDGFRELMKNDDFRLIKITFHNNCLEHIQYELMTTGITFSTIFPNIEGLSKDIKYENSIN
jgi:hypothetical protein